jgi:FGGY family of carbohydrate kinases, N-terminal domain/FGGY family of carbohydrate kinases, C-terminal domain
VELYAITGIQFLPFNTVYQLAAAAGTPQLEAAATLLLLPDLLGYWLTGSAGAERTNASTTALLDVATGDWSPRALAAAGIGRELLPALRQPGEAVGPLRPEAAADTGLSASVVVTAVGSHDTASAVVGVPAQDDGFAYISCGTWALVGVELDQPVLTAAGRAANFTNEGGVDGRVRYLRNVMGLWLLQESLRSWERAGRPADLPALLAAAADQPPGGPVVDPDDPAFLPRATCRRGSRRRAGGPASRPPGPSPSWSAASSTAWPTPSPGPSPTPPASPAAGSRSSTWSAAAPATACSASSPPTPAACPCSPGRSRPPPSATSWSRPAPTAASAAASTPSAPSSATPRRSTSTGRPPPDPVRNALPHPPRPEEQRPDDRRPPVAVGLIGAGLTGAFHGERP